MVELYRLLSCRLNADKVSTKTPSSIKARNPSHKQFGTGLKMKLPNAFLGQSETKMEESC